MAKTQTLDTSMMITAGPERDTSFFLDFAVFQVEYTLFRVPKEGLVRNSELFETMFRLPPSKDRDASVEGMDEKHPIHLPNITTKEFRALFTVLYPQPTVERQNGKEVRLVTEYKPIFMPPLPNIRNPIANDLSVEDLTAALRVATMYNMQSIRDIIIYHLGTKEFSLVDHVHIAVAHEIKDWIKPCILEVARCHTLSFKESCILGPEVVFMVVRLSEWHHRKGHRNRDRNEHSNQQDVPETAGEAFDAIAKSEGWDWC